MDLSVGHPGSQVHLGKLALKTEDPARPDRGDLQRADQFTGGSPNQNVCNRHQQPLKLDPTPQQRVRLLLTLGERLSALNREPEAYDHYRKILQDFPNYPDKLGLCKRLLPLAKKLGGTTEASEYESVINSTARPTATGREHGENANPSHNCVSR